MSSESDDSAVGFIRSYADRVRAEALEKAHELTSAVPPPWATGKSFPPPSPESMPPPASLPSSPPEPTPAPPAPQLEQPDQTSASTSTSDVARSDQATVSDQLEVETNGVVADMVEEIEVEEAEVEASLLEAELPPLPDVDHVLDDSTVADLEEIVADTRDELRQLKQELRRTRRDVRRRRRYDRRFGPE